MNVSVAELREISNKLYDHLEALGISTVEIPVDYYWHVTREQLYDPTLERVDPDLGQLSDDWHRLELIRSGARDPVTPALEWLGAILRATSEQVIG